MHILEQQAVDLFFLLFLFSDSFILAGADTFGCYKILGGEGCSPNESSIPVYILIGVALFYCYGVNFYLSFLPIVKGQKKLSIDMFI